jgi:membrane-bound inhibitor of C-type lysozyme
MSMLTNIAIAFSPNSLIQNTAKTRSNPTHSTLKSQSSENEEDWRNFRAKLVMQYRNADDTASTITNDGDFSAAKPWAYESGQAIEKGSIILWRSGKDASDTGLSQQYFHKAIILVLGE